jgi:hypothetical protein
MKHIVVLGSLLLAGAVQAATGGMTYGDWPPDSALASNTRGGTFTLNDPLFTPVKEIPHWLKVGVTLFVSPMCGNPECKTTVMEMGQMHSFQKDTLVKGRICDSVWLGQPGSSSAYPYNCLDDVVNSGRFYIRADDPVLLGKAPKKSEPSALSQEEEQKLGDSVGISQEEFDKAIPPADFSKKR